ncbi:hypothetical protein J2W42_005454 [Rhizobium tibeticum]|uniref:hypothetical protein n=1 Tax=Rhizobium tibeticum TaxID=501024 RepID=UPI00278602C3|nr:hypothetical protein [Rhizobium tibeticum]MDP9812584.1 hypothetical protein [Rhizobium tibeticum]
MTKSYEPDARDFYKMLFLCDRVGPLTLEAGIETTDAAFFAQDELPKLSEGRTVLGDFELAFSFTQAFNPPWPPTKDGYSHMTVLAQMRRHQSDRIARSSRMGSIQCGVLAPYVGFKRIQQV